MMKVVNIMNFYCDTTYFFICRKILQEKHFVKSSHYIIQHGFVHLNLDRNSDYQTLVDLPVIPMQTLCFGSK